MTVDSPGFCLGSPIDLHGFGHPGHPLRRAAALGLGAVPRPQAAKAASITSWRCCRSRFPSSPNTASPAPLSAIPRSTPASSAATVPRSQGAAWVCRRPLLCGAARQQGRRSAPHAAGVRQAVLKLREKYPDLRIVIPVVRRGGPNGQGPHPRLAVAMKSSSSTWRSAIDAFAASDAAMAKSGTVTLELALANVPMVVAYRVSPLPPSSSAAWGSGVEHASLVNLLAAARWCRSSFRRIARRTEIAGRRWLRFSAPPRRRARPALQDFKEVAKALGDPHPSPSERAAKVVLDIIRGKAPAEGRRSSVWTRLR